MISISYYNNRDDSNNKAKISFTVWKMLEYLHRILAGCSRRRKGNSVPGDITVPPCPWGTYIQRPGPPGGELDAWLNILLCKKYFKKVKVKFNFAKPYKEGRA
jgi:hypothetical protein